MEFYQGQLRQRGSGLGSILLKRFLIPFVKKTAPRLIKSVARKAVPVLKKQVKRLAPKVLDAGVGVLADSLGRKKTFKQAARARGRTLLREIIKPRRAPKKRHSVKGRARKKKPRTKRDIFG